MCLDCKQNNKFKSIDCLKYPLFIGAFKDLISRSSYKALVGFA